MSGLGLVCGPGTRLLAPLGDPQMYVLKGKGGYEQGGERVVPAGDTP